ncbi:MAG: hypothetical protein M1817_000415 [Caeruleum heppii]|nr:MAG: hypothetical protein M1817_000415 [Caeruleum heppii]
MDTPPAKRTKRASKPRPFFEPDTFSKTVAQPPVKSTTSITPQSPLFFSNSSHKRPPLPARFSSSEAAATMLSKARDEASDGIRTVKLPRGSFNGGSSFNSSSSPRVISTPGAVGPNNRANSLTRSETPDVLDKSPASVALGSVGMLEFLELDDRPTFIIDVGNPVNHQPGALQIVFANSALRATSGLLDVISRRTDQYSPGLSTSSSFSEFKAWATSFVKNNEALDACMPAYSYGGLIWSCTTLRKRLRLISGISPSASNSQRSTSSTGLPSTSSTRAERSRGQPDTIVEEAVSQPQTKAEPDGYFDLLAMASPAASEKTELASFATSLTNGAQSAGPPAALGEEGKPSAEGRKVTDLAQHGEALTAENVLQVQASYTGGRPADLGFFDWTRLPNNPSLPKHVQFARSVDWASTSLGPIEEWPPMLRSMCNLIMASPHPAAMYWGEDLVAIYNEAYILLAGQKHPVLMGQSYREAWAEIWDDVVDVFASAITTGQSTMKDDDLLFLKRSGFLEETYFSWSIIPLVGEDGSVVGLYNPAFEKSRRKIAERRMLTLRSVGECTATARELSAFWGQVLRGLEPNAYDAPFVLLYSVTDELESDLSSAHSSSVASSRQCTLEGSLGVPEGHRAAPNHLDLRASSEGFAPQFREALKTNQPVLLQIESGSLSAEMIDGVERRGFDDPCSAAVVCPIHPTTGEAVLGFLAMGVNPRRPYDDDYELFVQLLSRQLATAMASVVLFEEEIKRGQQAAKLAALDRIVLSEQLAARTQEAVDSETKFTRMAELAPVGIWIANGDGHITYLNDAWYEITKHPRGENSADRWIESVHPDDLVAVQEVWRTVIDEGSPVTCEFRFVAPWEGRSGARGETWVLASAHPEKAEDGSLKRVFGGLTDISQQKWAEGFQKRRMEEAVELKRQQENFIDITSHEMRNPLSAILQCADEVSTSLSNYVSGQDQDVVVPSQLIESNIDAAQTIALCAQHQKRIVDDILTLSKLDSALLLVTPVDVQPVAVVQRALKMFENELETSHMEMRFQILDSYRELGLDWVRLDPSRLLQVLINLTGNAIKFTKSQQYRTINVRIGASLDKPSHDATSGVSYFPPRSQREDITTGADWGEGEGVYLHFDVQDTGRGLTEDEKKLLFLRFSQASPRTHVQYGGSGLGLFISRELTELQGGEIGVSSESGKGSTFAFFIKARRSTAPADGGTHIQIPNDLTRKTSTARSMLSSERSKQDVMSSKSSSTSESHQSPPPARLTGSKVSYNILIVEDNLVNQRVLSKQLRNLGCTVRLANHGGEALDHLQQTRFWRGHETTGDDLTVILMDQEMPVMDGLTCTKRIRELQQSGEIVRHVPIIAVTANARAEQIGTALEAGMDDVVSKPFRIPDLIPKIEELTLKHHSVSASPSTS